MYTITLANGTKLTGLDMNGTNYVSKEKVDETIFKDNLSTMMERPRLPTLIWSSFSRWNGLTALSILRSVRRPRRRSW